MDAIAQIPIIIVNAAPTQAYVDTLMRVAKEVLASHRGSTLTAMTKVAELTQSMCQQKNNQYTFTYLGI